MKMYDRVSVISGTGIEGYFVCKVKLSRNIIIERIDGKGWAKPESFHIGDNIPEEYISPLTSLPANSIRSFWSCLDNEVKLLTSTTTGNSKYLFPKISDI